VSTTGGTNTAGAGGETTRDGSEPAPDVGKGGGAGTSNVDAADSASVRPDVASFDARPDVTSADVQQDVASSNPSGIYCGSTWCDPSTQVCCAESGALDPGSMNPLRCVPKGMCSGMSPMNIPCDDHADCAKAQPTLPVCCVGTSYGSPMGSFILVQCTTQGGCATTASVRNEFMCSGANDHDSCPAGKTCRPGLLRDGYFTCQ
jgi:hypothetical protein